MAVPSRRTSKTAKRKRRTHFKLSVPGMVACPNCGEMKLAHRICKSCGQYKGKEVCEQIIQYLFYIKDYQRDHGSSVVFFSTYF